MCTLLCACRHCPQPHSQAIWEEGTVTWEQGQHISIWEKCLQVLASYSPLVWESQLEILQHGQAGYWRFLHKRLHIVHRPCAVHILWTLLDSLKVISYLELFLKFHTLLLWSIIIKHSVVHAHTWWIPGCKGGSFNILLLWEGAVTG